jgi:electron transport complex protein RnfB
MPPIKLRANRREFLTGALRAGCAVALGGALAVDAAETRKSGATVWQIDPAKCIGCGLCATECVVTPSAVKCFHAYALCGYCRLCFGLLRDQRTGDVSAAENSRCPYNAIIRKPVEDPYYEISIDRELCNACGKCVLGCDQFGNGSLFLQISQDRCLNCNQCSIADACPTKAITRVAAKAPYRLKTVRR